jgi:uncharacterized protein (TIGR00290 family)
LGVKQTASSSTSYQGIAKVEKAIVSWSSGKDSALALFEVMNSPDYEAIALLTTIAQDSNRVSMHHVQRSLVERQAASLGLPLDVVLFTPNASNETYETAMRQTLSKYQQLGVTAVVSGDIFLDELRKSREDKLAQLGLTGIFPLWKRDTRELAEMLVNRGFKALITCVDTAVLDRQFLGRVIDAQFLATLPAVVDPCGENGEYHSFVFDGPIFREPVRHTPGEVTSLDGRYFYCDLLPN